MARPKVSSAALPPVCQAVLDLRNALGLTQQEMAFAFGVAVTTIARYEGGRVPEARLLEKLAFVARLRGHAEIAKILDHSGSGSDSLDKVVAIESRLVDARTALLPITPSEPLRKALGALDEALKLLRELNPAHEIERALSMAQRNRS